MFGLVGYKKKMLGTRFDSDKLERKKENTTIKN